jgi:cell division transport system permease protein
MKLVGATNWFIRVPYITEGFMQGLLGSAVAAIAISALCTWVHLGHQFEITTSNLVVTDAIVIVIGAVVGSVGSAVAIRRFLDV